MRYLLILLMTALPLLAAKRHVKASAEYQTAITALNDVLAFNFTNNITISVWLKFATLDSGGNTMELVAKGAPGGGNKFQFDVRNNAQKLEFYFANPDATFHIWQTTSAIVQTNTYTHVAVTFAYGTGASIKLYVDGALQAGSYTSGSGNALGLTNAISFHIASNEPTGNPYYDGIESEVTVWNGILTSTQIATLAKGKMAQASLQFQPSNIRFYMPNNDKPEGFTAGGANGNKTIERGPFRDHMDTGGTYVAQRVLSYQPNQ